VLLKIASWYISSSIEVSSEDEVTLVHWNIPVRLSPPFIPQFKLISSMRFKARSFPKTEKSLWIDPRSSNSRAMDLQAIILLSSSLLSLIMQFHDSLHLNSRDSHITYAGVQPFRPPTASCDGGVACRFREGPYFGGVDRPANRTSTRRETYIPIVSAGIGSEL